MLLSRRDLGTRLHDGDRDLENFVGLGSVHMSPYVPMERQNLVCGRMGRLEREAEGHAALLLPLGSWSRHPDGGTVAAGRQRSALPLSLPSVEVVFPGENANDVVCVEFLLPYTRDDNHQHPKCGCWYVSGWHTHVFAPGGPGKTTTTTTNGCQYEMDDTTGRREHRSNNDISSTHAIQMMAWRRAGVAACVDT